MANTYTTRLNLTKPEVGADTNAWGGHLNGDLDTIDANMVSLLLTSSQTMAGALNLPSNGLNVGSGQLQVTGGNVSASGAGSFGGAVTASTAPTTGSHLTNKTYTDATYLTLTGGTITGNLQLYSTGTTERTLKMGPSSGFYYANEAYAGWRDGIPQTVGGQYYPNGFPLFYTQFSNGNFVAKGTVSGGSDVRLKTNVQTITNALAKVNAMRGVTYDRIDTGEHEVGVIAQEMQTVLPEVVTENNGMLAVAYGNIVGALIEAIKELSAKVDALEART